MSPLTSVRGKLALALLLVVAGVLAIVYLIVVPSYQTSLENTELKGLQSSLQKVALPHFPVESYLQQQFVETVAQSTNARAVVFSLTSETPALLEAFADSATERDSTELQNDPIALTAVLHHRAARGTSAARARPTPRSRIPSATGRSCSRRRCTTSCRRSRSCAGACSSRAHWRWRLRCSSGTQAPA